MTIIIAVKNPKTGEVWISSDRMITDEDMVFTPGQDSKLVRFKNAVIGCAGNINYRNYLELFSASEENFNFHFTDKISTIKFMIAFKKFLKKTAFWGEPESNTPLHIKDSEMIIATKNGIFEICEDGGTLEHEQFCAIGAGKEMGYALVDYMYNNTQLETKDVLSESTKIISKYKNNCGGSVTIVNVSTLVSRPRTSSVKQ